MLSNKLQQEWKDINYTVYFSTKNDKVQKIICESYGNIVSFDLKNKRYTVYDNGGEMSNNEVFNIRNIKSVYPQLHILITKSLIELGWIKLEFNYN